MKAAGANACLIPSSDPHHQRVAARPLVPPGAISPASPAAWATWWSTEAASALWVDGRYFVQAARQLEGSEIELQKMGVEGVPTLLEYLAAALGEGQVLAVDGMVTAAST